MQIELIGCTGAGKSTLSNGIYQASQAQGVETSTGEEIALKLIRLDWVKRKIPRTLLVDLIAGLACLASWRDNFEFYLFETRILSKLPVGWFEKLNIARNVLKNIGVNEIVRRVGRQEQLVFLDEGTLHTAHYLFVHVSVEPDASDLSDFIRLIPLPDVVVYLRQDTATLIQRTLARGHKRIPSGSLEHVELFIRRAEKTFDKLIQSPEIKSRLLIVDGDRRITKTEDFQRDPLRVKAFKIISDGIDSASENYRDRSVIAQETKVPKHHRIHHEGE